VIVVAPSSAPRDANRYQRGLDRLREIYEVDVRFTPEQCAAPHGYLAATDERRAQQLNQALRDESARAIIAARGGYGCTRILDRIDVSAAARHPKWVIGYSDLTALQWLLYKETGLVSASAPVVTEFARFETGFSRKTDDLDAGDGNRARPLTQVLTNNDTSTWDAFHPIISQHNDPLTAASASLLIADDETLRPVRTGDGITSGPLLAGTLSVIVALAGTPYMPDLSEAVLVLEDTGEAPYRVDRMLTQLRQGGYLENLAAVILGSFREGDVRAPSLSMNAVLRDAFAPFEYPVLSGLPYGHILPRLTLPIGARATVDSRPGHLALTVAPRAEVSEQATDRSRA
jgi:muramoyltetrapeptide carboxypeptidase